MIGMRPIALLQERTVDPGTAKGGYLFIYHVPVSLTRNEWYWYRLRVIDVPRRLSIGQSIRKQSRG